MVGLGACSGWRALRYIKAIHLVAILQFASAHEVARIPHKAGEPLAGKEVRVQRGHHGGVFKLVNRIVVSAESQLGTGTHIVTIDRVPAMPLRLRESLLDSLHLPPKRWRSHSAGKEAQPSSLLCFEAVFIIVDLAVDSLGKVTPGAQLSHVGQRG